ncbi:MAG: ATP-binding protein [Pseudomonadota bacterium]
MISWTINYLFLLNAGLLVLLALFLISRKKSAIAYIFFTTNISLAVWNICIFLIEERQFDNLISLIVKFQLTAAMVFASGLYYFSAYYPVPQPGKRDYVNALVFAAFTFAIFFTRFITHAQIVDDSVAYEDGPGYLLYSIYLSVLGLSALWRLGKSWRLKPEYRDKIKYFFIGIAIFVACAITFNLVLPSLGIYDFLVVGRLSATFAPLFIFYAMTKHDFLDITVIINKTNAWIATLLIFLAATLILHSMTVLSPELALLVDISIVLAAVLSGHPLQKFLLTTAKRKFVRGWYSTEEIINRLADKITLEKSREAIFKEVATILDEVFELEALLTLVAVRDERGDLSHYKVLGKVKRIKDDDALIATIGLTNKSLRISEIPDEFKTRLAELEFACVAESIVLPFHSPEHLEGLIILGEKSNQGAFSDSDIKFFNNLISFMSPVLYRLTPMERLERFYTESRQKLHDAEIQLIRAQKVESILHATRQCHHEIRTPLNIIRLGIGRIKTLSDLETYKNVAREEIDHALEIVEETLTITEVDKGSVTRRTEININDVINRCLRLVDRTKYNVLLELEDIPPVHVSFSDMQVVITNLFHNAIEAMPDGGNLVLTTHATNENVVITIEDTGEGIPFDLRSRVWEPYFSGRKTEVGNSTAGRGWGLTIVNRIITEHEGTIRLTSEENVGTKFTINLPLLEKQSAANEELKVSNARS